MTAKRLAIWFALVLLLAVYSRWQTGRSRGGRCDLDGNAITQATRVDLMVGAEEVASFCSVTCAAQWPNVPAEAYWQVRDEESGRPLDAARALFVQSNVVSVAARGCHIHVFNNPAVALQHARQYDGKWIPNPLPMPLEIRAVDHVEQPQVSRPADRLQHSGES